jgi:galactose mutarotase-like enzyme
MHQIKNNYLQISVKDKGAELNKLISLNNDFEYIWQANAKYWARYSPVLFPIVGKIKDDTYIFDNKKYCMSQHGFARDKNFKLIDKTKNKLCFLLKQDKSTLKIYPFKFELYIDYELQDNKLIVHYRVMNTNDRDMFFSIGAHPGFNCPLVKNESYEDYYLEFEHNELVKRWFTKHGLLTNKTALVLNNEKQLSLYRGIFKDGAFIFKNLKSSKISLKSRKNRYGLSVNFKGFPYLGIWAKSDANFICIEPWYGVADKEDTKQTFEKKQGIIKLSSKNTFKCCYSITIDF